MIVVLAIDALEYDLVTRFNCKNLKQQFFGKTDISEFSEPRTIILWSSFSTGKNMEVEILSKGDFEMWNTKIPIEDTFFSLFQDPFIIDLPGYNYDTRIHEISRKLLKAFFETEDPDKKESLKKKYNHDALQHHQLIKSEFLQANQGKYDFVLGYFSAIDVIGHLNFGNTMMMKMLYRDLDDIAAQVHNPMIVLSDHGMKNIGIFGDHTEYGFWSSADMDLGTPGITDFYSIISQMKKRG